MAPWDQSALAFSRPVNPKKEKKTAEELAVMRQASVIRVGDLSHFGGCSPGDVSHSVMSDAISFRWVFLSKLSRLCPGGNDLASSRSC